MRGPALITMPNRTFGYSAFYYWHIRGLRAFASPVFVTRELPYFGHSAAVSPVVTGLELHLSTLRLRGPLGGMAGSTALI